jgi:putative aldouronate transport system substrate-binding protein
MNKPMKVMKGDYSMKKMHRTVLALLICLVSMSILLTGCSPAAGTTTKATTTTGTTAAPTTSGTTATTKDPNAKPIEITYTTYRDLAANESIVTKKLPELLKDYGFNVVFKISEYGTFNPQEWEQKFKVSMSSGDQPCDIMQLPGLMAEGLKGGWFAELQMDIIQEYMPTYVKEVDSRFPMLWAAGKDASTGKLYAIPSFNMYGPTRHAFVYRGDWLAKMNLEAPVTLDDFEVYLRAVRTQDPNGNGQNDEYGYTGEDKNEGPAFREIFGAYGIMPGMWMEKDGQIVRGDVQPEAKEALEWLRKWYAEGLIPKGVMTTAKDRDEFYANKIGAVGSGNAYGPAIAKGGYIDVAMKEIPGAELLVALPPVGPDGHTGTWQYGPKKYVLAFGKHLENDQEKMGLILSIFELTSTDKDLFELTMLGEKGIHWDFADPAATSGAIKYLGEFTDVNKRLTEVGVRDLSESAFCPVWVESVYSEYIDPEALKYATMNKQYYDPLMGIALPSGSKYLPDLITLSKVTCLDIITGKKPVDAFDAFVAAWNANGGDQLAKEANEIYQKIK